MDQILIKDLLVRAIIGISERERADKQDILINIVVYTDTSEAAKMDQIDYCVDYRLLTKKVYAFVEKSERYTVEALASDVVRLCLEEKRVTGVRVRVEKPGAVRFCRSVGVEIERYKS